MARSVPDTDDMGLILRERPSRDLPEDLAGDQRLRWGEGCERHAPIVKNPVPRSVGPTSDRAGLLGPLAADVGSVGRLRRRSTAEIHGPPGDLRVRLRVETVGAGVGVRSARGLRRRFRIGWICPDHCHTDDQRHEHFARTRTDRGDGFADHRPGAVDYRPGAGHRPDDAAATRHRPLLAPPSGSEPTSGTAVVYASSGDQYAWLPVGWWDGTAWGSVEWPAPDVVIPAATFETLSVASVELPAGPLRDVSGVAPSSYGCIDDAGLASFELEVDVPEDVDWFGYRLLGGHRQTGTSSRAR